MKTENPYYVWPYVKMPEGEWTLKDDIILWAWHDMQERNRDKQVFYGGKVTSFGEFIGWLQSPENTVVFVFDIEEKRFCLLAWINGLFPPGGAMCHFTALGKYKDDSAKAVFKWFANLTVPDTTEFMLHVLLGITPVTNKSTVELMKRHGFQTMEVPKLCYMHYDGGKIVPGVIGALNLR